MEVKPISFGRRLAEQAALHPARVAITFVQSDGSEDLLDWAGLDAWANRAARLLASHGAGPGATVCIALPNSLEHFAAALGAWRCGACTLPMSPRMPAHEFDAMTGLLDRRLVIADREGATLDRAAVSALRGEGAISAAPLPDVIPHPGKAIGSGGSTGRPKIIMDPRPHARVPGEIGDLARIGFRSHDVQLVAGPLYHNTPFVWSHLGLFEGHHLVVLERFDAARCVDLIELHRCGFAFLAPTMMVRIARLPGIAERDLSSLHAVFQTAAACPAWLKRTWIGLVGPERVFEAYGSSEALGATRITGTEWLAHPGSVGRADPAVCDLRILDAELREVSAGTVGEVFFRPRCHPLPTYEYVGADPARSTPDGFAGVGDLGYVDEEGYLFLVDRRVDMIVTGGANVYTAEVEAALTEHPAVGDAAVIGLTDDEWGRRVHAVIEPAGAAPSEAELAAWLRQRLTPYKLPKSYEFVAALPRDPSGKIRRSAMVAEREGAR
jgi:bile acid-coenzyme A ligase